MKPPRATTPDAASDAAQREMALAARDIELLLGSIRSILVTLDGQNRVRRFNSSAETTFSLTAEAVAGWAGTTPGSMPMTRITATDSVRDPGCLFQRP